MRIKKLLATALLLALFYSGIFAAVRGDDPQPSLPSADATASQSLENRFRDNVHPFLENYCLGCHGKEKPKGELDLSGYGSADGVANDLARWELVFEQLKGGTMPPAKAKRHPDDNTRQSIVDWIQAIRKREGKRNAGDPGRVLARRLSNAEYDYTIRDLTGVDIRPTREFPVDPANEAGFDNSAESLTMSPALVKKYLEAARFVVERRLRGDDQAAGGSLSRQGPQESGQ